MTDWVVAEARSLPLGAAVGNLATALVELGEWDEAALVFHDALDVDHLDHDEVHVKAGWLVGLRGVAGGITIEQESVPRSRESEDPQDQAAVGVLDALAFLHSGDVAGALGHAMGVLDKADTLGIGADTQRWAWPLAARAPRSLGEVTTLGTLLAVLDAHPVGHLPKVRRAEHQLAAALFAPDAEREDGSSVIAVAGAVGSLREVGNPYQLAHGLIDYAEVLLRAGADGAGAALAEAKDIA